MATEDRKRPATEDTASEQKAIWPPEPLPVPPYGEGMIVRPTPPEATAAPAPEAEQTGPAQLTGPQIKAARERLGITQSELARLVGRSRSFIALVEQGRRRLSEEDERKVREVLNL